MSRVLVYLIAVLGLHGNATFAEPPTHVWPGAAPCADTLQTCINAAAAGDVVRIATNAAVSENLNLPRSIALEGASGYSARLAAGFGIRATSTGNNSFNIAIRRVALTNAGISLIHNSSAAALIEIRHVDVDVLATAPVPFAGISVQLNGSGGGDVRITDNRVRAALSTEQIYALGVEFIGNGGTALIDFNHVESVGAQLEWGILSQGSGGATPTIVIANNEVRGRFVQAAIGVIEGPGGATSAVTASVLGNAVVGHNYRGIGIFPIVFNGSIAARILNNTVARSASGIYVTPYLFGGGSITGAVLNNLLAHNDYGLNIAAGLQAGVTEDYNLLFGNITNAYTPGAHDVSTDPLLRSFTDLHVQSGSPAISAGNGFAAFDFADAGTGLVDADGLRRVKGAMDIGAYEYGDFSLRARADAPAGNGFAINQASINGNAAASLFATVNAGAGAGIITDAHPTGVYYFSGLWRIFNQDGSAMPAGVEFNVFVPRSGDAAFVHVVTAGNLVGADTVIDLAELNNQSAKILLATSNWNPGATPGVYNNHTTSVGFNSSNWVVENNDFAVWTLGAAINIYGQDPSPNAYLHTATAGNTSGSLTVLDHPLLNGSACAQVNVTPRIGNHGNTTFDVFYNPGSGRWAIYNHALPMAVSAQFNIVIDAEQVATCAGLMFSDGFEE
jgi:hypothetical protein